MLQGVNSTSPAIPQRQSPNRTQTPVRASIPSVYDFRDYRTFLDAFFELKKSSNPSFSQSAFVRRAGMGQNSRGYLKLVIEGKRNLTANTIRGFASALGLSSRESQYFENLVFFNQAKTAKDREFYFHRLIASAAGKGSKQARLSDSQMNYYSSWYYPAIRELVAMPDFREDPEWICAKLRQKVNKKQTNQALADLLKLGMLARDPQGKLMQVEPLIKFPGGFFNLAVQNFHIEMMERAKESLLEDDYVERNASSVTLTFRRRHLPDLIRRIAEFRDELIESFGAPGEGTDAPDCVLQVNLQAFQLTSVKRSQTPQGERIL